MAELSGTVSLTGLDGVLRTLEQLPPEVVSKAGGPVKLALKRGALVLLREAALNLARATDNLSTDDQENTGLLLSSLVATRGKAPTGGNGERYPHQLSGGMRQRVMIAMALSNAPRLLIADEPTGQLDSTNAEAMMSLIASLVHDRGVAAIVSTHDPRMAEHADRVVEIHDGRIQPPHVGRHAAEVSPAG